MNKKYLLKLGVPFIALSLVAACGTAGEDAPNDDPGVNEEAPLNQEDDNNNENPMGENGVNEGNDLDQNGEGVDDQLEDEMNDLMDEGNVDEPQPNNDMDEEDQNQ